MPLERQIVSIPFAAGVDTQPDPKQIDPGKLLQADNVIYESPKQLKKRNGYSILGAQDDAGNTITAAHGLATRLNSTVLWGRDYAYAYAPNLDGTKAWRNLGAFDPLRVSWWPFNPAGNAGADLVSHASDPVTGVLCAVIYDGSSTTTLRASIVDRTTQAPVAAVALTGVTLTNPYTLKVIWSASYAGWLVLFGGSVGSRVWGIKAAAPTAVAHQISVGAVNVIDGVLSTDGAYLLMAKCNADGAHVDVFQLDLSAFTLASAQLNTTTAGSTNGVQLVAVSVGEVHVFHADSTWPGIRDVTFHSSTLAQVAGSTQLIQGALSGAFLYNGDAAIVVGNVNLVELYTVTPTPTATLAGYFMGGFNPVSRPWAIGADAYVVQYDPYSFNDYVVRASGVASGLRGVVAGVLAKSNALQSSNNFYRSVSVDVIGSGDACTALYLSEGPAGESYGAPRMVQAATLSWAETIPSTSAAYSAVAAAGIAWCYDGSVVRENGFIQEAACSAITNGSAVLAAGNWAFRVLFQWVDANGQTHRSAPSAPFELTMDGAHGAYVSALPLRATNHPNSDGVKVQFYAQYPGESVMYLQGSVANDITAGVINFQQPASFARTTQLYTTGTEGELANEAPPALAVCAASRNRVYAVPAEAPNTIWISKERVDGYPVEFSSFMTRRCDERGGPITAIYPMDDKTVVFKRSAIFFFSGAGPADNGTNDDTTDPSQIASDVGALSQASIVMTPLGLMFQSAKGIHLLERSMQTNYIGADVETYTTTALVTSASLSTTTREVRFTTDSGYVLVYNYNFNAWSRQVVTTPQSFISGVVQDDKQWLAKSDGTVWRETPGTYIDPGDRLIAKAVTTGWISFADLDGFQRVRRLMLLFGPNPVTISTYAVDVFYDFNDSAVDTVTIPAAALTATSEGDQVMVHLSRQKCSAIKVRIAEGDGASDAGIRLSALSFEVGVKRGFTKLPAAKKVGTS